jgi:glycosyltransferase involved in cell wall biosynthesis
MRIALVLETHNLRSRPDDTRALARLLAHLKQQSLPLRELHELVITCDGIDDDQVAALQRAAGRELRFVKTARADDYYDAKNIGFSSTESELVVFADSDCWPDREWLERMCAPFEDPRVQVAAGRTTYKDTPFGRAATAIDFLYFRYGHGGRWTRNFYANNVAFRRGAFPGYARATDIYRGPCQQLGMRLFEEGVHVEYVHAARTVHRFPDSRRELVKLRLLRGNDAAAFAEDIAQHAGFARLARSKAASTTAVLSGRAVCSLRQTRRSLRESALMLGIHALDCAGAAHRLTRGPKIVHRESLGYHHDRDRLAA